jgi:hypothetical protein
LLFDTNCDLVGYSVGELNFAFGARKEVGIEDLFSGCPNICSSDGVFWRVGIRGSEDMRAAHETRSWPIIR